MSANLIDYTIIANFLEDHWIEWCEMCGDEYAQEQIDLLREFANEDN